MNIYAKEGDKVTANFKDGKVCGGYDHEQIEASKYLKEGVVYTVHETFIYDFSSKVYLKEFPGKSFNTVQFKDYTPEGELPVDGLLYEQETGGKKNTDPLEKWDEANQDQLWEEVESFIVTFTGATKMEAVRVCETLKKMFTLSSKERQRNGGNSTH